MFALLLLSTFLILDQSAISSSTAAGCISDEVRLVPVTRRNGRVRNYVQYCVNGEWRSLCTSWFYWSNFEARVVCRQLGYSAQGFQKGRDENGPPLQNSNFFSIGTQCSNSDNRIQDCGNIGTASSCTCGEDCYGWLNCRSACVNGEVRLIGGSTNREGRVEVCVDGHWGTVCNKSQEGIAEAMCSQLGFAAEEARAETTFPSGFVPISRCTVQEGQLSCTQITDASCDHSMDLGVVCSTYKQLYNKLLAQQSSTDTPATCPTCEVTTCPTVTCPECPTVKTESWDSPICTPCPAITCPTCAEKGCPTLNCSTCPSGQNGTSTSYTAGMKHRVEGCVSTPVLGGVVGVLVTVLVVLVIGWSLSCVALVKRNSHSQKQTELDQTNTYAERQLDNPVYDSNMETHNYSSSGPTYELVDTSNEKGHSYAVLEQSNGTASHDQNIKSSMNDKEHHYHVLECEGVTGGRCDYEVPVSGQIDSHIQET